METGTVHIIHNPYETRHTELYLCAIYSLPINPIYQYTIKHNICHTSHYKFQQHLLHKAKERKCCVLLVNEAYTSKTINWTGEIIHNLGGKKVIKSLLTDEWMDRDWNGALGILLKALVDSPSLKVIKSAFVN